MLKNRSSSIALEYTNGDIRAIRVFDWNGITMHDGQILLNCWDDFRHMVVLIALGDLHCLGPSIEDTVVIKRFGTTVRDDNAPRTFQSRLQWRNQMRRLGCSCFYLYEADKAQWHVWDSSGQVQDINSYKV